MQYVYVLVFIWHLLN